MGQINAGHRLDYWCYTSGNDGYTWTYLDNVTTGKRGWVRDSFLPGNGSSYKCVSLTY